MVRQYTAFQFVRQPFAIERLLGGGFEYFFFTTTWGNDPIWRAYFSDGLVQPPTRLRWTPRWMKVRSCSWSRPLAPHGRLAYHADFYCVTVENNWMLEGSSTMELLNIEMLPAQNSMFRTSWDIYIMCLVALQLCIIRFKWTVVSSPSKKKDPLWLKKKESGSWFLSDFPLDAFFPKLFGLWFSIRWSQAVEMKKPLLAQLRRPTDQGDSRSSLTRPRDPAMDLIGGLYKDVLMNWCTDTKHVNNQLYWQICQICVDSRDVDAFVDKAIDTYIDE